MQNAFWTVTHSDPYGMLAIDRLHAWHSGVFGKHLWGQLLDILEKSLTRAARARLETQ